MKNRNKKVLAGLVFLSACCIFIIYMYFVKTESIVITWMPTPDIQEQVNNYVVMGYCVNGHVSEDGLGAVIQLTEWQRKKWLKKIYTDIGYNLEKANEISNMKISVSADAKNLTVHANRKVNFQTLATYLGIIAWDIEKMQVLNGQKDWGFEFIVKDIETEKVLYTAFFPKEGVRVYESFWDEIE